MSDILRGLQGHFERTGQELSSLVGDAAVDALVGVLHPTRTAAEFPPKPTDTVSVPVTDVALRNAVSTADALEMIVSGWPELTRRGFESYLTDAASYLRELADAVTALQRVR